MNNSALPTRSPSVAPTIRVQPESFDLAIELAALTAGRIDIGAIASFIGLVRTEPNERLDGQAEPAVKALTLEHYPGMTERALAETVKAALSRWPLTGVTLIHRVGRLLPGEPIVLVLVASAHRAAAFAACEFLMDDLKTTAPFWKKEQTATGEHWVQAQAADQARAARWQPSN